MLYLDEDTCRKDNCSHPFFAPIFSDNTECRIKWSESTILYGATKWKLVSSNDSKQLLSVLRKSTDLKTLKVRQRLLFKTSCIDLHRISGTPTNFYKLQNLNVSIHMYNVSTSYCAQKALSKFRPHT